MTSFKVGDKVVVKRDFVGVPKGSFGKVVEEYPNNTSDMPSIIIEWQSVPAQGIRDGFCPEEFKYLVKVLN